MPSPNSLILPMALGLSLVTVTAFVVYFVFKKDEEESSSKRVKTSRVNVIEIPVPKKIVPALIGRNGSNIKDIENKTGALIHFKKFSDQDYDVCILRGRNDATQLAENLILDFIKQQPDILDQQMKVPSWACGRIIGTGGESIKDISHRSGARVKVEGLPSPDGGGTHRMISLKGTKEQIDMAKGLIENCVAQEKCRREIEQSKRHPRHITPSPSPSNDKTEAATSDNAGDVTTHVKYKRPESASSNSIEVFVSAVSSPSRFWVQFVGPQVTQLDELVNHMTEYYSSKENREAHALKNVTIGAVVAAVFRHDGRWYRARVHDIRNNEFDATKQVADVFFLDYGDSEYVGTHELCELRADLLRLRFQAMECFLAGVKPAGDQPRDHAAGDHDRWDNVAVERFEELTQVARWKPLVSRTCTYKKTTAADGDKDKEIPGIKLYDVTEEGELDIGATLIQEGLAAAADLSPRASPPKPTTPFGDLGKSSILGMPSRESSSRASSVPNDHKDQNKSLQSDDITLNKENDGMSTSKSLGSGLERTSVQGPISNFDLSYPNNYPPPATTLNGSHFADAEKQHLTQEQGSSDTQVEAPIHTKSALDDLKANMNRIDSHHGNLEALGRQHESPRN